MLRLTYDGTSHVQLERQLLVQRLWHSVALDSGALMMFVLWECD